MKGKVGLVVNEFPKNSRNASIREEILIKLFEKLNAMNSYRSNSYNLWLLSRQQNLCIDGSMNYCSSTKIIMSRGFVFSCVAFLFHGMLVVHQPMDGLVFISGLPLQYHDFSC